MDGFTHYMVNVYPPLDWEVYGNEKLKEKHPDTKWAILVPGPRQSLMFAVPDHTKIEDVVTSIRSIYTAEITYKTLRVY